MTPLTPIQFTRGPSSNGMQSYLLTCKDSTGNEYISVFATQMNFTRSTEKVLSRLVIVPSPEQKPVVENAELDFGGSDGRTEG